MKNLKTKKCPFKDNSLENWAKIILGDKIMKKKEENKMKMAFLKEAETIKRKGIEELLGYLVDKTDFFTAPASTQYHDSEEGGLVIHSLSVYDVAKELNDLLNVEADAESIAICALFHDICKANFYIKEIRNKKIDDKWVGVEVWAVKDQLPMGHGEKSVYLINKYMQLTDEEALAIRWHLGGFDTAVHFSYPYGTPSKQAFRENKLVALIAMADLGAAYLL